MRDLMCRLSLRPQLRSFVGIGKPGGQNTFDCVGRRVEQDRLTNYRRIAAVAPVPETPTQYDCGAGVGPIPVLTCLHHQVDRRR